MEKTTAVRVRKKRPPCIIFEPTEKARTKLDKVLAKGYSKKEVLCELLEKVNPTHYKMK